MKKFKVISSKAGRPVISMTDNGKEIISLPAILDTAITLNDSEKKELLHLVAATMEGEYLQSAIEKIAAFNQTLDTEIEIEVEVEYSPLKNFFALLKIAKSLKGAIWDEYREDGGNTFFTVKINKKEEDNFFFLLSNLVADGVVWNR